jgi:hypothetical protein
MSDPPPDREGQVLRASVTVTGWEPGSEEDIADTIQRVTGERVYIEGAAPFVVFDRALPEEARNAAARLTAAGAKVTIEDVWVERGGTHGDRARPTCPVCGSPHIQPFHHAGPASRVNRKCTDCGHLFRSWTTK